MTKSLKSYAFFQKNYYFYILYKQEFLFLFKITNRFAYVNHANEKL